MAIRHLNCSRLARLVVLLFSSVLPLSSRAAVPCSLEFAQLEGIVKPQEQPYRQELCLNGLWQFQPVAIPKDFKATQGIPPELALPQADRWSATPIKIPSHWNVNTWGGGRPNRKNANQKYWPDSIYYPSYPIEWDTAQMGWLRRNFRVPEAWSDRQIVLHFEAVAGDCHIWINGKEVKQHFDNYLPFEVDVTDQIRRDADNKLMVGVRGANLFNKTSSRYPKFSATYPPGSQTDSLIGIWQDVFLLGLPKLHIADTFVKPLVKEGVLEAEVILENTGQEDQVMQIQGEIFPWTNLAAQGMLTAMERKWRLKPVVLAIPKVKATVKAGQKMTVILRQPAQNQLHLWSPQTPNLYALLLTVSKQGRVVDRHYTRFGWRELAIQGPDLQLNGEKIKLMGEWAHPFGAYIMSPRYVWVWYQMVKDFGGNCIRPHAQIHPRFYLDLADEMGVLVLEETAIFGSSVRLNAEELAFWERCSAQYDGMVQRDRNHPSVMGWSFANEMFAIPNLNKLSAEDSKTYNDKLVALSRRSLKLDPTRTWITSDGDEDLQGTLPVWSRHFGIGNYVDKLPKNLNKPLVVSESGGAYFATPEQLSVFNGDRAYESYLGRNEALAIDLYDNVVRMALPQLAYFTTRQIVWWGLEHLNLGYDDFSRLPTEQDGVFFSKPFLEGKPGMQPERMPPYATTLNPGWDPSLPLSKPLPVYYAMKAAIAKGGPQPCPWDHKIKPTTPNCAPIRATVDQVAFVGPGDSPLWERMTDWGVPLVHEVKEAGILIIDGQLLAQNQDTEIKAKMDQLLATGGTVLIMVCDTDAPLSLLNALLPKPLTLTDRRASMVQPHGADPWATGLGLRDLYFANVDSDRQVLKCGLAGPLVERGRVVLEAGNTDWELFNNMPQKTKAAAVTLYEHVQKPPGAALVRIPQGKGFLALSSLDYRLTAPASQSMWRQLLSNMGVKLNDEKKSAGNGSAKNRDLDPLFLNEK